MRGKRLCRTLLWACGLLVVIAIPPSPSLWWTSLAYASPSETPRDISTVAEAMVDKATLPTAEAVTPTNQTPAAEAPKPAPASPAAGDANKTQVAQLPGDPGAPLTAADLIRQAYDFMFYKDFANERACLEQAVAAEPGSKDAGRALALLAASYARTDPVQAQPLFSQVANTYTDPEVVAFADLVEAYGAAARAQDWVQAEQLLADAAATWKGTATGAWAALCLGDQYRWDVENWDAATATFQAVLDEYRTGPVAEEAAISVAECVNWSETGRVGEAIDLYQAQRAP